MKSRTLRAFFLLLLIFSVMEATAAVTLTDKAGRDLEVTISAVTDTDVTVKRTSDGKAFAIKLNTLSEESRRVVTEWREAKEAEGKWFAFSYEFVSLKVTGTFEADVDEDDSNRVVNLRNISVFTDTGDGPRAFDANGALFANSFEEENEKRKHGKSASATFDGLGNDFTISDVDLSLGGRPTEVFHSIEYKERGRSAYLVDSDHPDDNTNGPWNAEKWKLTEIQKPGTD